MTVATYASRTRAVTLIPTTAIVDAAIPPFGGGAIAAMYARQAAAARPRVTRGDTTSAAPPTISGKVKKNGLWSRPVRTTRRVAKVMATLPSRTNFAVPNVPVGRRSWRTTTNNPAAARSAKIAGSVSRQRPVRATIVDAARMKTHDTI